MMPASRIAVTPVTPIAINAVTPVTPIAINAGAAVSSHRNRAERAVRRLIGWLDRHRTIRRLQAMSDRMLSDIGIERYQIESLVNRRAVCAQIGRQSPPPAAPLTEPLVRAA